MKPNHYVHDSSHVSGLQTKKKKKKAATPAHDEEGPPALKPAGSLPQAASRIKPVSKKAKGKDKDKKKDEANDLDKALAELSIKCVRISFGPSLDCLT